MKQGWQIKKLSEICEIYAGQGAPQGDENYCTQGTPFIKAGNLEALTSGESESNIQQVSEDVAKSHKLVKYKKGSVVFAKSGMSCMKGYIYTLQGDCYVVSHLAILTPKQIESSFLNYCLQVYKPCSLAKEAAFPSITLKELSLFEIPVPSFSEQQRIVALLDAEFAKIDVLKANAEKNLQNAKDLFQAALKKELEPKEGWKTKRIEEIAEIKGGKRVPKGYKLITERTTHPYIRVSDFNDNGSVDLGDIHYIEDWVYKEIQRYTISFKDVYISIAGTIGKSGIIPKELEGANLTENACKLVLNQGLYNRYVYYCTINDPFKSQIVKLTMQAAQPKLALTRLATATISIPSLEDQQSIVARLDTLNEKCKTLQANYEKTLTLCDDLKQSLLRKAFNGEI